MCGIIGQMNSRQAVDKALFIKMRDTLTHRGPDDCGLYLSKNNSVALGHRRLSFLDLTPSGRQPMCNENRTIWLTFNGEIYNYLELKQELTKLGHAFQSNTDSEVIIHGYEQWGSKVLQKLNGMFAFGIWDEKSEKLFLARDRFGIKPLYYYRDADCFIFSSEIKGIVENPNVTTELDYSSLCDYLVYRYVPSPKCIWKSMNKIPPAHYLEVIQGGVPKVSEYWRLPEGHKVITPQEAAEEVDSMLTASVQMHIRSDVPVGSFLSGGYDSSALVHYMKRVNYIPRTFSIGFKGWNESEHQYAELVSERFGTPHTTTMVDNSALDLVESLMYFYDEPIADISIIPTFLVSNAASKHVKAVFSGEGADELFCGYTWHIPPAPAKSSNTAWQRIRRFAGMNNGYYSQGHYAAAMAMGRYDNQNLRDLLSDDLREFIPEPANWFYNDHYKRELQEVKRFQYLDIKTFLGELVLTKTDRASMANSLEVRVPFLDHRICEYIFKLDQNVYFRPGTTKPLLRENIKNALPDSILSRKKQGFVGPDSYYMNIDHYSQILNGGKLLKEHLIKKSALEEMIRKRDHWRLWKLMVLECWYQKWA